MKTLIQVTNDLSWLGRIIKLDTFGKYQIATYKEKDFDTGKITEKLCYIGYVNAKTMNNQSFDSYEACLADLIACNAGDTNGYASRYFMKMIN